MADVDAIVALTRSAKRSDRLQALDGIATHFANPADNTNPSSPTPSTSPPPLLTLLPPLFTLMTDPSDATIRQRAFTCLTSSLPSLTRHPLTPLLLSTLTTCLTPLDPTHPSDTLAFQSLPLLLSSSSPSLSPASLPPHLPLVSLLLSHLSIPPLYTTADDSRQQSLPPPPTHPSHHAAYLASSHSILSTLLLLPLHPLPNPLRLSLLSSLITHSFSIPPSFTYRYPASCLALLPPPEWTSPTNICLSLLLQHRLLPLPPSSPSPPPPSDDEGMQALLYESALPSLLKRLRERMGGKGEGAWKRDVSSAYVVFHALAHLLPSRSTSAMLAERVHDVVPLLLPLLNDWQERSRCMGALLLSHLLHLLPFHAISAFAPLLQHTLHTALTDRESAATLVVLPTSVDLLLSTTLPFPTSPSSLPNPKQGEGDEEATRITARLTFFSTFLQSLSFLSLSTSATPALVCAYLEQLVRLLVYMHRDVLVNVGVVLEVLGRLGGYWDEEVRERAWVCVGCVMEVGGRGVRRRVGEVMERLLMAELEAKRQAELNARSVAFVTPEMRDAPFISEARERSAGWRRTAVQVRDMQIRMNRKWPRLMKGWADIADASHTSL